MLRICISGLTCSGKTSLGKELARDLGIMHVTKEITASYKSFKENEENETSKAKIIETAGSRYASVFDEEVKSLAKNNDCVVTTWLGPWIVKEPTLSIWLNSSTDSRVERCAKRDSLKFEAAKRRVMEKDKENVKIFKRLYKININERSDFDIELNTERLSRKEIVSLISMLAIGKEKKRFR
jgi:cytidylate kinase